MEIIIDIDKANNLGLNPLDFFYLTCLDKNINCDTMISTAYLIDKGFLNEQFLPTSKFKDVIVKKTKYEFQDVFNLYPHRGGTRTFKTKNLRNPDGSLTGDADFCIKKFNKYHTQNPNIADLMHKGLSMEIILRKKGNGEQFFQDIRTWFNQKTWEKYCELELTEVNNERIKKI